MGLITALLSWYDEQPAQLAACVERLRFCDRIVACDGAYWGFPGGRPASPPEQMAAIVAAAAEVPLSVHQPARLWHTEIEKRRLMIHLARGIGWLLVVDADEFASVSEPDRLRSRLDASELDVAEVEFRTTWDGERDTSHAARRLFRAAGLTVERSHSRYLNQSGVLCSGVEGDELLPALDLRELLELEHRKGIRTLERDARRQHYEAYMRPVAEPR